MSGGSSNLEVLEEDMPELVQSEDEDSESDDESDSSSVMIEVLNPIHLGIETRWISTFTMLQRLSQLQLH
jgi:hypothetical protein